MESNGSATFEKRGAVMSQNPVKITVVKDTVELKRKNQDWKKVSGTTEMRLGDQLRKKPGTGASVKVRCGNGTSGLPFSDGEEVNLNDICPSDPRGALDDAIPYTISPRSTLILTNQPTLRWNATTNAKNFKVTVRGRKLNWTTQVSRDQVCQHNICELVYPGEPPLQLEVSYILVIETDTNRSSAEITVAELGFKLIDEYKAEEVHKNAQQIEEQNLSAREKALEVADLFTDSNLAAEAITTLEALAKDEKSAAVYRQLGELYRWIGLPLEAEVQYQEAVKKAEVAADKLELAAAQAGLGEVCWILDKRDKARNLLEAAKAEYANLGDAQAVSKLETRLKEMK